MSHATYAARRASGPESIAIVELLKELFRMTPLAIFIRAIKSSR